MYDEICKSIALGIVIGTGNEDSHIDTTTIDETLVIKYINHYTDLAKKQNLLALVVDSAYITKKELNSAREYLESIKRKPILTNEELKTKNTTELIGAYLARHGQLTAAENCLKKARDKHELAELTMQVYELSSGLKI